MSSSNQLSFLPDDYLMRKRRRRTVTICAALFVAVMAGMGVTLYLADQSLADARREAAEVDLEYADAARRIQQVEQMQEKQRRMARQAELTASLLEKIPRSYVLAEITNALPTGVSLLDFGLESRIRVVAEPPKSAFEKKKAASESKRTAVPPVATPKQYDVGMKITGIARTDVQVAWFISRLSQSVLFREVNLIVSEEFMRNEERVRRFQLEMTLSTPVEVTPELLQHNRLAGARVD